MVLFDLELIIKRINLMNLIDKENIQQIEQLKRLNFVNMEKDGQRYITYTKLPEISNQSEGIIYVITPEISFSKSCKAKIENLF
jgi:hypothetical protein